GKTPAGWQNLVCRPSSSYRYVISGVKLRRRSEKSIRSDSSYQIQPVWSGPHLEVFYMSSQVSFKRTGSNELAPTSLRLKTMFVAPWDKEAGGVISVLKNLANYLIGHNHEVTFFLSDRNILLKKNRIKIGFAGVQLRLNMPFGPKRRRVIRTLIF